MPKSLVINASQVSATGLATDQGRGRGGVDLTTDVDVFYGLSLTEFFYNRVFSGG